MTDAQITDLAASAILLAPGLVLGLLGRRTFDVRWLVAAAVLLLVNNALLARVYRLVPNVLGGSWNWTGMALALLGTLAIAALPVFGWRRIGLTFQQRRGSLVAAIPVLILYCAVFVGFAWAFPSDPPTREDLAFQLTMPGLEEEPFFRGLLLLALDRAFRARVRFLGVEWGWGAVLSCVAFGLIHALDFSDGAFAFDWMVMALTALPSFIAVWLRYRTGSLVLPIVAHNFGNAIGLLL